MNCYECYECGSGDIIEDYREGDTICRRCGLVLSERNIQDTSYYNPTFYEDHEEYIETVSYNKTTIDNTFDKCIIHLNFPDTIKEEASKLFAKLNERGGNFRGDNLKGIIASLIYIACHQKKGGIRHAKEIYESLGIGVSIFNKSLRTIYKIIPEIQEKLLIIKEENTLTRQIRNNFTEMSNEQIYSIYHKVLELDIHRKQRKVLIGSSPFIVNSILIFIASEMENMNLCRGDYVKRANISRATLDKHYETLKIIFKRDCLF
jgi:transcription initiation factor TFIIIB Brf1 subunit/transcription initiation factor TFIIB